MISCAGRCDARELALTDHGILSFEDGAQRRFDVELFIVHPTLDPAEITAALGLQASIGHGVEEPRKTPKGTPLLGNYQDTRWRHSVRYDVKDQWFADRLTNLVDRLVPHKAFLVNLRTTGGRASVIVQFLGDGYLGDQVPRETLGKLVELGLDLGIECFSVP
ncbi:DUF4279 domain-containing protein [Xanthobacter oligotrophicus]|uniref:DUF4279 domain-containing protein n=1 Tax=Xanthobacter oligotrophicus TaxID=2607286 RepID=UPI00372D1392